jgi:multiple sugar transport system substrate-binding protein
LSAGHAGDVIVITGIAWDHRRCWGPLEASVAPYRALTGEDVRWERRSLYSFGEGDLGAYADRYDLVIYDHPFVGDISREGWMVDLSHYLTPAHRAHFASDEVGASWRSYAYGGGIWGLPLDTAAQTAAWRPDLLERHGFAVPTTLAEVRRLAERGAAKGLAVGWPSVPTDLMCTLVSLAASMGLDPGHGEGDFLAPADAEAVVGELKALAAAVHPRSKEWNPIRCLDHMAAHDDVAYVPYLFNYVNYSSGAPERKIIFGRPPALAAGHEAHTILGGAGIGVSAKAKNPQAAFDYAMWLCSPQYQAGDYVKFGGQPGSRAAWTSEACNALTGDFFRNTLPVMDNAYLRPTHPGFVPFFHDATLKLAEVVYEAAPLRPFVDWLNARYEGIRPRGAA